MGGSPEGPADGGGEGGCPRQEVPELAHGRRGAARQGNTRPCCASGRAGRHRADRCRAGRDGARLDGGAARDGARADHGDAAPGWCHPAPNRARGPEAGGVASHRPRRWNARGCATVARLRRRTAATHRCPAVSRGGTAAPRIERRHRSRGGAGAGRVRARHRGGRARGERAAGARAGRHAPGCRADCSRRPSGAPSGPTAPGLRGDAGRQGPRQDRPAQAGSAGPRADAAPG